MSEKMIDFPVVEAQEHDKLKQLIISLGEHLQSPLDLEEVRMLRVKYDGSCREMDIILKQLAGDPDGFRVKRIVTTKSGITRHYPDSGSKPEKGLDPMGS